MTTGPGLLDATELDTTTAGLSIAHFTVVEQLGAGGMGVVYGAEDSAGTRAAVKLIPGSQLSGLGLARFERETELLARLDHPAIVRYLDHGETADGDAYLAMEWLEGESLDQRLEAGPLPWPEVVSLGLRLAAALEAAHAEGVVHRDVKPSNVILVDGRVDAAKLLDFGVARLLDAADDRLTKTGMMLGTPCYMSPEQARGARQIDARSDLFSLGSVLYECLTGTPPFQGTNAVAIVTKIVSAEPAALDPGLAPASLRELLGELLAKLPGQRVASATELLDRLQELRPIALTLPEAVFGRERELGLLCEELDRACASGPRIVIVAGPPGIGKSALVGQLRALAEGRGGCFLRGKFDRGTAPLAAVCEAFDGLVDQLLRADPAELERWRQGLVEELGRLVEIVIELVPRMGELFGDSTGQLPEPVHAGASRNRVRFALARLLARLSSPERPVLLALDDIHRADHASADLIGALLAEADSQLLIVGTARTTEGALSELLAVQARTGRDPKTIELEPLAATTIDELLRATLAAPAAGEAPPAEALDTSELVGLGELLARKTAGNPLFVRQFLALLSERGLLRREAGSWWWDTDRIDATELPTGTLELIATKLAQLAPPLLELITVAGVVGSRFDPALLARVLGRPVEAELAQLGEEGLLVRGEHDWCFSHDRVREAVISDSSVARRQALHLEVGRALLETLPSDEALLELVEHLDRGYGLTRLAHESLAEQDPGFSAASLEPATRVELAELNGRAGQVALGQGAPGRALALFERCLELRAGLESEPSEPSELLRSVRFARAEALGLVGEFEAADATFAELLAETSEPADYAALMIKRCWVLVLGGERRRALEVGLDGLRQLGVSIPLRVGPLGAGWALARMTAALRGDRAERLRRGPALADAGVLAALELIHALGTTAYVTSPELFTVLVATQLSLLREHGWHDIGRLVLGQAALIFGFGLSRHERAAELMALACEERERCSPALIHKLAQIEAFAAQWQRPYVSVVPQFRASATMAYEVGDLETAVYAEVSYLQLGFFTNVPLPRLTEALEVHMRRCEQWGTSELAGAGRQDYNLYQRLMRGPEPAAGELDTIDYSSVTERGLSELNVAGHKLQSAQLLVLFGRPEEALILLDEIAQMFARAMRGTWYLVALQLFHGLAAAMDAPARSGARRRGLRRRLRDSATCLRRWADAGACCGPQAELLEGEVEALRARFEPASLHLSRAAEDAAEHGMWMVEALACERLARLAHGQGHQALVQGPLRRARDVYARWGARAKVEALEREWHPL